MIPVLLSSLVLIGVMMAAMAIGVMVTGKRLRGSCGGPNSDCWCKAEKSRKKAPDKHLPLLGESQP